MASGAMGEVYKAERVPIGKLVADQVPARVVRLRQRVPGPVRSRDARDVPARPPELRQRRRLRRVERHAVPGDGLRRGHHAAAPARRPGRPVAGAGPRDRASDHGRARARARAGHHPPRHQAREHHDQPTRSGTGEHVRILDFGLARLRGNVGRDATQTNMVVGTPNYMAPEQTVAGRHDRRAHRSLRARRRAVRDGRRRASVCRRGHARAARHAPRGTDPAPGGSRARGDRPARRPPGADRQGDGEVGR